jgi:hypothetical protein
LQKLNKKEQKKKKTKGYILFLKLINNMDTKNNYGLEEKINV